MKKQLETNLNQRLFGKLAPAVAALSFLAYFAQSPIARADDSDITPFKTCQGTLQPLGWSDFHCPISGFVGRKPIDLLWVIDNSGSMTTYQQNLIQNAGLFINALAIGSAPKWKIGIISTSEGEAPYVGFTPQTLLNYQTPNPIQVFQDTVAKLGIDGSTEEKTITPVMQAFDKYLDFLRAQANLGIIMVTDEKEQSTTSAPDFLNYLKGKKGNLKNVSTYGLFAASEWNCDGDPYLGSVFEQIVQGTNGKTYPLCQATPNLFTDMMTQMLGDLMSDRLDVPATLDPAHLQLAYNSLPVQILKPGPTSAGGDFEFDAVNHQIVFNDMSKYDRLHHFILSFKVH